MSFLLDPILLLETGGCIGSVIDDEKAATAAGAATLAVFYGISIPLYTDSEWTRPIWKVLGAKSGRDWMLNSGVFDCEYAAPPRRTNVAAALIFATYPLWLYAGYRFGRRRREKAIR